MTSVSEGPVEVNVTIAGHSRIDFDKKKVRRALLKEGRAVQRIARRLVARKAVSEAGQYPGKQTGALQKSIKLKAGSGGFWVKVAPYRTPEIGPDFYPAYLNYGVKAGGRIKKLAPGQGVGKSNRRRRGGREALLEQRRASAFSLAPRANYLVDGLATRRDQSRAAIQAALRDALIPR